MTELNLAGIQIGSHVNDWTLDRDELSPVFAAAERLGASIFVHPWDMIGSKLMNKYWLPVRCAIDLSRPLPICC